MAEKVKLNKNSLREQKQALGLYQEFLPTLELRKQQLQTEVRALRKVVTEKRAAITKRLEQAATWAPVLAADMERVRPLVSVQDVVTVRGNVAGVKVPVFQEVKFETVPYSLAATDPILDDEIAFWFETISLREEISVLEEQLDLLDRELTKTTQRINLYEKVLIPQTKENIRKIKVYLGDQQTAAVCRAKLAKEKIVRKAASMAAAVGS